MKTAKRIFGALRARLTLDRLLIAIVLVAAFLGLLALVQDEGSTQAQYRCGNVSVRRTTPLYPALVLGNAVFQDLLGHSDLTYYVPFAAGVLLICLGSDYNVYVVGRIWQEAERMPLREAIAFAAPRASKAIGVAGIALATSFGMLAVVPIDGFRELAFMLAVGALISLFGSSSGWPGRVGTPEPARETTRA